MKHASIHNRTKSTIIAHYAYITETDDEKRIGLSQFTFLSPGHGMVIHPASSITTEHMSFPIDVIFVNGAMQVCRIYPAVLPGTILTPAFKGSTKHSRLGAIELPAGTIYSTNTDIHDNIGFGSPLK